MLVQTNVNWQPQYTTINPSTYNPNLINDGYFNQPKAVNNDTNNLLLTPLSPSHSLPHRDSFALSPSYQSSNSNAGSRSSSISGPVIEMQDVQSWTLDHFNPNQLYSAHQIQQPTPSPNGRNVTLPEETKDPLIIQSLKADGKPKRPMNAYFIFMKEYRPKLGAQYPQKNTGEISGMLSQMWKDMPTKDRDVYKSKHAKLMAKFNNDFPNYQYERAANGTRRHGSRGGKGALKHAASMNFQYSRSVSGYSQHQHQGQQPARYEAPITPPEHYSNEYFPSTSYQQYTYEAPSQEYYPRQVSQSYPHHQHHAQQPQPRRVISESYPQQINYQPSYSSPVFSSPQRSSPPVDRRASYYDPRSYPTQLA